MAVQPHKAPPAAPEAKQHEPAKAEKAPAPKYADGEPIADQQRASSAEIEQMGMAKYIEEIDERDPDDKPKQVPGVAPPAKRS